MLTWFSSSGAESSISSVLLSSTTASARSRQRLLSLKTLIPERKRWSGSQTQGRLRPLSFARRLKFADYVSRLNWKPKYSDYILYKFAMIGDQIDNMISSSTKHLMPSSVKWWRIMCRGRALAVSQKSWWCRDSKCRMGSSWSHVSLAACWSAFPTWGIP